MIKFFKKRRLRKQLQYDLKMQAIGAVKDEQGNWRAPMFMSTWQRRDG